MLTLNNNNFYCDTLIHAHSVQQSCPHYFPLYLWPNSAEDVPIPNQLLSCLYFPQWADEINEGDWQKCMRLTHSRMDLGSGYITENKSLLFYQGILYDGKKLLGKKTIIGLSLGNLCLSLYNSPSIKWCWHSQWSLGPLWEMTNKDKLTEIMVFLFKVSPVLALASFLMWFPMQECRKEVFMQNGREHSLQQEEWTMAKETTQQSTF